MHRCGPPSLVTSPLSSGQGDSEKRHVLERPSAVYRDRIVPDRAGGIARAEVNHTVADEIAVIFVDSERDSSGEILRGVRAGVTIAATNKCECSLARVANRGWRGGGSRIRRVPGHKPTGNVPSRGQGLDDGRGVEDIAVQLNVVPVAEVAGAGVRHDGH